MSDQDCGLYLIKKLVLQDTGACYFLNIRVSVYVWDQMVHNHLHSVQRCGYVPTFLKLNRDILGPFRGTETPEYYSGVEPLSINQTLFFSIQGPKPQQICTFHFEFIRNFIFSLSHKINPINVNMVLSIYMYSMYCVQCQEKTYFSILNQISY